MKEILINNFNGNVISTFYWKDKICFFSFEVTSVLGYVDGAKSIQDCIKKEFFQEGEEYFILKGRELKEFKDNCPNSGLQLLKQVARLLILTEIGLYGFLQYSNKKGVMGFKKWIRSKVLPSIREKGYYSAGEEMGEIRNLNQYNGSRILNKDIADNDKLKGVGNLDLEKFKVANETFRIIEKILDRGEDRKLSILESIYKNIGIEIGLEENNEIFLDLVQIALELGMYDIEGNPNCDAIEEIIKRVSIEKEEKKYVDEESTIKYSRIILDRIVDWLVENENPILLTSTGKDIFIMYS